MLLKSETPRDAFETTELQRSFGDFETRETNEEAPRTSG